MKNCIITLVFILFSACMYSSYAQAEEAQQLLLDVEKLTSLKNILNDLKKSYEVLSAGYGKIKNITENNFNLHQAFLNSLLMVSPEVKHYKRVGDIITTQIKIISEYKKSSKLFQQSGQFTIDEISYIGKVYSNLFDLSVKNLDDLAQVLMSNQLRMSDDERLFSIDGIWQKIQDQFDFLQSFNNHTKLLALQRAKDQNNIQVIGRLYGLTQ